MAKFENPHI